MATSQHTRHRTALSDTGDWQLKYEDEQDVRGYRALDKDGTAVGTVEAMLIDTAAERVSHIVLDDGTQYPARDISIGDDVVYLTTMDADAAQGEVRVYGDSGQVVRRERVQDADYDAHADTFRKHHSTAFTGTAYADYEPAYRYGFESAHEDRYRNRSYFDAEDDLRTDYTSRDAGRDFDTDRRAVRYGYTHAQRSA